MSTTPHNPRDVLIHIHEYLSGRGFFYTRQAIANLYLSLRSKPFVILAGPSGTGKTQLVRLVAEALGYRANCLLVPVRPDWADGSDLLGYVDLQGHFRRQPLLHWVEKAQAEPDQPFFVILDEMNLARVEYYFSDFLSILETREKQGDRVVSDPLVPASLWAVAPSAERWGALSLPDNLYLVGTVNMDETTYPFSRKVLDRANTIEMNEVRLDWPEPEQEIEPLKEVYNDLLRAPYVHARDLHPAEKRILAPAMQWLGQVNQLLREVELPLGYRVRDEVAFYLLNRLSIKELISEGEALDRQLVQKILPRVQGSAPRVGAVLPKLMHLLAPQPLVDLDLEQVSYADLYARLGDPRRKRLPFPFSLEKLLVMYRRFEEDGFTSFWL